MTLTVHPSPGRPCLFLQSFCGIVPTKYIFQRVLFVHKNGCLVMSSENMLVCPNGSNEEADVTFNSRAESIFLLFNNEFFQIQMIPSPKNPFLSSKPIERMVPSWVWIPTRRVIVTVKCRKWWILRILYGSGNSTIGICSPQHRVVKAAWVAAGPISKSLVHELFDLSVSSAGGVKWNAWLLLVNFIVFLHLSSLKEGMHVTHATGRIFFQNNF